MKRANLINSINEMLQFLAFRLKANGKQNLLDLNVVSEQFYVFLLNEIFDYNLKNVNLTQGKTNVAGIDLRDSIHSINVQVTTDDSKAKIEHTLTTSPTDYNFNLKMLFIASQDSSQKNNTFSVPTNIFFNPKEDILDLKSLSNCIMGLPVEKMENVYELLYKEFGYLLAEKRSSRLAIIVDVLSKSKESEDNFLIPKEFDINKKISFNELDDIKEMLIEESSYYYILNNIYSAYEGEGISKMSSIMSVIRKKYNSVKDEEISSSQKFYKVVDSLVYYVRSKSSLEISDEELNYCLEIITTDAFIKCKIFDDPEGYINDITISS